MGTPTGNASLGARLRELRQEKGLKLAALANQSGVSLAYVSEVERGRKLPSLEVLDRLAGALGLSVLEVLDGVAPYDRVRALAARPGVRLESDGSKEEVVVSGARNPQRAPSYLLASRHRAGTSVVAEHDDNLAHWNLS